MLRAVLKHVQYFAWNNLSQRHEGPNSKLATRPNGWRLYTFDFQFQQNIQGEVQ